MAQIVITNIGPQSVSDELIRANIHIKAGDTYVRNSVDQDVLNLYATGFFYNIRVADQLTDQGVILTYMLEGKLRLTGINFEGNTKFGNSKLLKKVSSKIGEPLDERKLFNDSQAIEKQYEKSGYTHTKVKYELVNIDCDGGRAGGEIHHPGDAEDQDRGCVLQRGPRVHPEETSQGDQDTEALDVFPGSPAAAFSRTSSFRTTRKCWQTFTGVRGDIDFDIKDIRPSPIRHHGRCGSSSRFPRARLYKVGKVAFKGHKLFCRRTEELRRLRPARDSNPNPLQHTKSDQRRRNWPSNWRCMGWRRMWAMTFTAGGAEPGHPVRLRTIAASRGYIDVRHQAPTCG